MPKLNGDALKQNVEQNGETQDATAEILTLMKKRVCPSVTSESANKRTREKITNTTNKMERRRYAPIGQSHKCDQM